MIGRRGFACSGWLDHMEWVVENAQGLSERGDGDTGRDWAIRSDKVPPHGNAAEDPPTTRRHHGMGCPSTATLAVFRQSATSGVEEAANQVDSGHHVQGRAGEGGGRNIVYPLRSGAT